MLVTVRCQSVNCVPTSYFSLCQSHCLFHKPFISVFLFCHRFGVPSISYPVAQSFSLTLQGFSLATKGFSIPLFLFIFCPDAS